jgi:signal transduction histidine kinase
MAEQRFDGSMKSFAQLIHPDDRESIIAAVERFLEQAPGDKKSWEHRIVRPNGEVRWLEVHGRIILDQADEPVRLVGTAQDITERKRTEAELQRTGAQLRALAAHLQSVREEERASIAREIHDELGQVLTALKMDLAIMGREIEDSGKPLSIPDLLQEINGMQQLIDATIAKIRTLITKLRPEVLDSLGLLPALEWQAQEFQERTGLHLQFHSNVAELDAFDARTSTAVFRIFQEALTNIARHAQATGCVAEIRKEPQKLSLAVSDNGIGITSDRIVEASSFGVLGMKERALSLGGSLEIENNPAGGTIVKLTVPLQKQKQGNQHG